MLDSHFLFTHKKNPIKIAFLGHEGSGISTALDALLRGKASRATKREEQEPQAIPPCDTVDSGDLPSLTSPELDYILRQEANYTKRRMRDDDDNHNNHNHIKNIGKSNSFHSSDMASFYSTDEASTADDTTNTAQNFPLEYLHIQNPNYAVVRLYCVMQQQQQSEPVLLPRRTNNGEKAKTVDNEHHILPPSPLLRLPFPHPATWGVYSSHAAHHPRHQRQQEEQEGLRPTSFAIAAGLSPKITELTSESLIREQHYVIELPDDEWLFPAIGKGSNKDVMLPDTGLVLMDLSLPRKRMGGGATASAASIRQACQDYITTNWPTLDLIVLCLDFSQAKDAQEKLDLLNLVKSNVQQIKQIPIIVLGNKIDCLQPALQKDLSEQGWMQFSGFFDIDNATQDTLALILQEMQEKQKQQQQQQQQHQEDENRRREPEQSSNHNPFHFLFTNGNSFEQKLQRSQQQQQPQQQPQQQYSHEALFEMLQSKYPLVFIPFSARNAMQLSRAVMDTGMDQKPSVEQPMLNSSANVGQANMEKFRTVLSYYLADWTMQYAILSCKLQAAYQLAANIYKKRPSSVPASTIASQFEHILQTKRLLYTVKTNFHMPYNMTDGHLQETFWKQYERCLNYAIEKFFLPEKVHRFAAPMEELYNYGLCVYGRRFLRSQRAKNHGNEEWFWLRQEQEELSAVVLHMVQLIRKIFVILIRRHETWLADFHPKDWWGSRNCAVTSPPSSARHMAQSSSSLQTNNSTKSLQANNSAKHLHLSAVDLHQSGTFSMGGNTINSAVTRGTMSPRNSMKVWMGLSPTDWIHIFESLLRNEHDTHFRHAFAKEKLHIQNLRRRTFQMGDALEMFSANACPTCHRELSMDRFCQNCNLHFQKPSYCFDYNECPVCKCRGKKSLLDENGRCQGHASIVFYPHMNDYRRAVQMRYNLSGMLEPVNAALYNTYVRIGIQESVSDPGHFGHCIWKFCHYMTTISSSVASEQFM